MKIFVLLWLLSMVSCVRGQPFVNVTPLIVDQAPMVKTNFWAGVPDANNDVVDIAVILPNMRGVCTIKGVAANQRIRINHDCTAVGE